MEDESVRAQEAFRVPRQLPVQTPQDAAGGAGSAASLVQSVKPGGREISKRAIRRQGFPLKNLRFGISAVLNRSEML
jgi:hypothetical protein